MNRTMVKLLTLVLTSGAASIAQADVKLNGMFSDHAVLQRDQSVAIWGTADAGEKVSVSFRGANADAIAGADGKWKLTIPTGHAGGPFDLTVEGKNKLSLKDILVNEV